MQMTFEATTSATLWFSSWHFMGWSYWGSCVGLFLFCLLHEFLTTYRSKVKQAISSQTSKQTGAANQQGSNTEQLLPRSQASSSLQLWHSALYAINIAFSYLLMLAVMTYNVGYFFVVVLGLATGHLLFQLPGLVSSELSDVCCVQR
ncbi:hypothetical protein WJX74_008840 [Apatococcus lobatus]|uniref:Copper transport protein n=2 Tax=Apatococcus TaxID=904362 RepID=A0AAW1RF42_9CHLO